MHGLTDARARADRYLYERLVVFREDLAQATYFARYLLKKGWHFEPWDHRIRWPTYMQQAAFTTALVAAYSRPFTVTRSGSTLPTRLASFNSEQRALHKKVLSLRNTVYAHTEVALHKVVPVSVNGRAAAVLNTPLLRLSKEEVELLVGMISHVSANIDSSLNKLAAIVG